MATDRASTSLDFTVLHDHGILVVEQLGSRAEHEGWDVYSQPAHLEVDSVYVAVLPSFEGAVATSVRTSVQSASVADKLTLVFQGRLEVSSRVILVGDSDRNVEIRLPLAGVVDVSVFVDVAGFASQALVVLTEVATIS